MRVPRRRFLHLASGGAVLSALPKMADAQDWPNRIVRLIVPTRPAAIPMWSPASSRARFRSNSANPS